MSDFEQTEAFSFSPLGFIAAKKYLLGIGTTEGELKELDGTNLVRLANEKHGFSAVSKDEDLDPTEALFRGKQGRDFKTWENHKTPKKL